MSILIAIIYLTVPVAGWLLWLVLTLFGVTGWGMTVLLVALSVLTGAALVLAMVGCIVSRGWR